VTIKIRMYRRGVKEKEGDKQSVKRYEGGAAASGGGLSLGWSTGQGEGRKGSVALRRTVIPRKGGDEVK